MNSKKQKIESELKKQDLAEVKEHYQDYPYPFRDPEDEKKRLLSLAGEHIGELNHFLYKGKECFTNNFRILIAGGGTGDSAIFLAEQLKNTNAEIVYLDFSKPSMEVAQKRAAIRNLNSITWINDSILNIPELNIGKFDFINCSGVLHHLENPPLGLQILKNLLTEKGGMHLMIYAKYGRTGVYHVQEIMKMINKNVSNRIEEIMNGKIVINALPPTNWFMRAQELIGDHINYGDVGLYDLFLHKQDRAYSIPEMHEFINDAGLNFVDYAVSSDRIQYKIENYIKDFSLLQKIKKMDLTTQHAICELIVGNIIKHSFYVSNQKDSIAQINDLNNIPYFYTADNIPEQIFNALENNNIAIGQNLNFTFKNSIINNYNISLTISNLTKHIFKHMIGEDKSLKQILESICEDLQTNVNEQVFIEEIKTIFAPFFLCGILLLRDKSIKYS